jgi:hypothetical protein
MNLIKCLKNQKIYQLYQSWTMVYSHNFVCRKLLRKRKQPLHLMFNLENELCASQNQISIHQSYAQTASGNGINLH